MASRHIILLREGYYSGRLNFKYDNPYSQLREQLILEDIEKELFADFLGKKIILDSQILVLNPKASKSVYGILDKYMELTLPYLIKHDKISNTSSTLPPMPEEEQNFWRNIHAQRRKENDK